MQVQKQKKEAKNLKNGGKNEKCNKKFEKKLKEK